MHENLFTYTVQRKGIHAFFYKQFQLEVSTKNCLARGQIRVLSIA